MCMSGCSIRLASSVTTAPPTAVVTEAPATALPTASPTEGTVPPTGTPVAVQTTATMTAVPTVTPVPTPTSAPTPDLRFFVSVKVTGPEGELFSVNEFETEEGATVFSILQEICEKKGVRLDYSGSVKRGTVYVEGIDGIYEKVYGGSSGWIYYVNDKMPNIAVSSYKVKNRDAIEWRYVK